MNRNSIETSLPVPQTLRAAGIALAFANAFLFPGFAAAKDAAAKSVPAKTSTSAPPAKANAKAPRADSDEIPNFAREALVGWALRDVTAGDTLLESRLGDQNLTPGSTQKLFTTWIALELLGGDRTYVTELFHTGTVAGGTLKGDLILKGGGDPSFGGAQFGPEHGADAIFNQWAKALKEAGIRRVDGCVIGDGTFLTEEGPHPASLWEDAGNYYAGTVSGLAFNDNLFQARFSGASAPGRAVSFQGTTPSHTGIARFDNRLVTGPASGQDSAYFIGGFPSPVRGLRGTYPAGRMPFTIKGSLPNPAWTCAREFRDFIAAKGITVSGPQGSACGDSLALPNQGKVAEHDKHTSSAAAVPVAIPVPIAGARHVSPPLKDLIRIVNQKSDNNYAAQMLALLGKGTGHGGDWRGGLEAAYAWLDAHGFDRRRVHLKDGNGLSRYNWIAPTQTTLLLAHAYRHKAFPEFRASLIGSPGATGKLDRYGEGWDGRLYAKTGTLEGVSALAGYLKCASGRWIAFSISANNFEARNGDAQKYFGPMLRKWASKY